MTRKKEEWSNGEVCFVSAYCVSLYIVGAILLLYFKVLFGLGFIIAATIFFIPALIEAKKKVAGYTKKRRIERLRKTRETIIVGGTPQKHHKKKKNQQQDHPINYPIIDDFVSKGKAMHELGLFYEKKKKKVSSLKIVEPVKSSSVSGRTYRQLNKLFDALNDHKRIRIAHHANIGSGHHGGSIKKMVKAEAKRRGVYISVRTKGRDVIIEK